MVTRPGVRTLGYSHSVLPAGGRLGGREELGEFGQGVRQGPHVAHHGHGLPLSLRHLLLPRQLDGADLWAGGREGTETADSFRHLG